MPREGGEGDKALVWLMVLRLTKSKLKCLIRKTANGRWCPVTASRIKFLIGYRGTLSHPLTPSPFTVGCLPSDERLPRVVDEIILAVAGFELNAKPFRFNLHGRVGP